MSGGGGGGGAEYSAAEIAKVKQKLEGLNKNAAGIMQLASDTAPEMKVWGLVGMITGAAFLYWKVAGEDTLEHLKLMGESLQDNVLRVDAAGKTYSATEDGITQALTQLEGALDDTGMPGF
ncbi:hypothetical protein ABN034_17815 [Actinopolymorpha sp. B11F2]|uniref:hypothetical protein n=1 Tax=Actinopolymorpha sp. B11F2 TaxID=3160862 RepID=UPI0032E4450B